MMFRAIIIASIFLLPSAIFAQSKPDVVIEVPVDPDFRIMDFVKWGGDAHGVGYVAAISLINYNGDILLCGAGHYGRNAQLRSPTQQFLRNTQLKADGRVVLRNMTYFNTVSRREFERGTTANCASTGVPSSARILSWGFDNPRSRYRGD